MEAHLTIFIQKIFFHFFFNFLFLCSVCNLYCWIMQVAVRFVCMYWTISSISLPDGQDQYVFFLRSVLLRRMISASFKSFLPWLSCVELLPLFLLQKVKFRSSTKKVFKTATVTLHCYYYDNIKNCDNTFIKIILRLKKIAKNSDDVSTLANRHYQVKIC